MERADFVLRLVDIESVLASVRLNLPREFSAEDEAALREAVAQTLRREADRMEGR